MLGLEILDVAIGIIFVYLLVSIVCASIREGLAAWLKTRAAYLECGIRELLHDKMGAGLATAFYTHPLIYSLFSGGYSPRTAYKYPSLFAKGGELPSYIPARNFALALMDIAARGPETDAVSSSPNAPVISLDSIRTNIGNLKNPPIQRLLLTMLDSAQEDLDKLRENLEAWYNSAMERISGSYKRSTQSIIFWIALFVAAGLNINSITIADFLYRNDSARAALVARAQVAVGDKEFLNRNYEAVKKDLEALTLPIGWAGWDRSKPGDLSAGWWNGLFAPILGWLMTAFAATMGAPFWFDVLGKVMVVRSTVKPQEKGSEETSETRRLARSATRTTTGDRKPIQSTAAPGVASNPTGFKSRQWAPAPNPRDSSSDIDACGSKVDGSDATSDEDLPPAEGGVART